MWFNIDVRITALKTGISLLAKTLYLIHLASIKSRLLAILA